MTNDQTSPTQPPQLPRKELRHKWTAGLLAIFFGWLGAHKFYLRQYGWGLGYLLFSCTNIPTIAGIIEGIIILTLPEERFNEQYNTVTPVVISRPKRTAAGLAFFLGCFGAHKFYLRETGWGIVYLMATITGFYLSWQVLTAAGLIQQFHQLMDAGVDPDKIKRFWEVSIQSMEGLLWPSFLSLIPSIAGIIDGFALTSMSDERFEMRYGLK